MRITAIQRQKKYQGRYSIYIDGKYTFSLNEQQLVEAQLHVGKELSPEQIQKYKIESDLGKLYYRTLKWLAIRPRSTWEIESYLARITNEETQQKELLKKLKALGQVNDKKFAENWITSRRTLKAISRKKLWVELKQKHVASDVIDEVLAADETDELSVLKDLIQRKSRQSQYADRTKLMAYLARQGFRYDQIKQAFEELS